MFFLLLVFSPKLCQQKFEHAALLPGCLFCMRGNNHLAHFSYREGGNRWLRIPNI